LPDCLFCKIADGSIEADFVRNGELTFAVRDINPQAPVHVLIISKQHLTSAADLTPKHAPLMAEIAGVAQWVAASEGIADSGSRLVTNVGPDGGQTVPHLHVHLLGGRQMRWPPG
jgi:histidine triad (HIT) family protein